MSYKIYYFKDGNRYSDTSRPDGGMDYEEYQEYLKSQEVIEEEVIEEVVVEEVKEVIEKTKRPYNKRKNVKG